MGEFEILGQRLKELRKSLNKNQKEFAEYIGISAATLSAYETGVKNPSVGVFKTIAEKCNISIDWLCGIENNAKHEIKTYSDLIKILLPIAEEKKLKKIINDDEIQLFDEKGYGYSASVGMIAFIDEKIIEFFSDWNKMLSLLEKDSIDREVYDLWIEKTLNKYNFNIDVNTPF